MTRFQFQLRTLLLVTLVVGCGLGWWFRPYTIQEYWPNGQLKSQLAVRRNLQGDILTNGTQAWWWRNGQLARRGESYGQRVGFIKVLSLSVVDAPLENEEVYSRQGEAYAVHEGPNVYRWLHVGISIDTDIEDNPLTSADRFPETPHE